MGRKITVEEIITKWGFDVDVESLDKAGKLVNKLKLGFAAVAATAIAGVVGLFGISRATARVGIEAERASIRLGVNAQLLQEYALAASLAGLETEDFVDALKDMTERASEAARGEEEAAEGFTLLGIKVTDASNRVKPALQLFDEIANGLAKIEDPARQTDVAMKIFSDTGFQMLPFLKQGSKGIADLRREVVAAGAVLDGQILKGSSEFTGNMSRLSLRLGGVRNEISRFTLPLFNKLAKLILSSTEDLVPWIASILRSERAMATLKTALIFVSIAAGQLAFSVLPTLIPLLITAAAATKAWIIAAAPFILIPALITGIILVIEDLITFVNGGNSAFGALLEKMKETSPLLSSLADFLRFIFGGGLGEELFDTFERLSNFISGIVDTILTIPGMIVQTLRDLSADLPDLLGELLSGFGGIPAAFIAAGRGLIPGGGAPTPEIAGQQAVQSVSNQSAVTNTSSTGPITVNGVGGNSMDIAQQVQDGVRAEMVRENRNLQRASVSGIRR